MTMTAAGVAKLIEETGELQTELGKLQQTLGKRLAMWDQDEHWDGSNLKVRMEDEFADVSASMYFVSLQLGMDSERMNRRQIAKIELFGTWHEQIANNDHGIDAVPDELAEALIRWRSSLNTVGIPGENQAEDVHRLKVAVDGWKRANRTAVERIWSRP